MRGFDELWLVGVTLRWDNVFATGVGGKRG